MVNPFTRTHDEAMMSARKLSAASQAVRDARPGKLALAALALTSCILSVIAAEAQEQLQTPTPATTEPVVQSGEPPASASSPWLCCR